MRTLKQVQASRLNGAKSKGPVTPEGKARASQNGLTHGLTARPVLLPNENPEEFHRLRELFLNHWQPANEMEAFLVDEMVGCQWRLLRAEAQEAAVLDIEIQLNEPHTKAAFASLTEAHRIALGTRSLAESSSVLTHLERHQTRLSRQFQRAWKQLTQLQAQRQQEQEPERSRADSNVESPRETSVAPPKPATLPAAPEHTPAVPATPFRDQDGEPCTPV